MKNWSHCIQNPCLWCFFPQYAYFIAKSILSDAESKGVEDATVNVWEDNWDDDAKEDDFANQLR